MQTQALFGNKGGADGVWLLLFEPSSDTQTVRCCSALAASSATLQGGGNNPFAALGNMGNIMENVKKAQQLVQVEAAKAQEELAA